MGKFFYNYDRSGRISQIVIAKIAPAHIKYDTIFYEYDKNGDCTESTHGAGRGDCKYDSKGRGVEWINYTEDGRISFALKVTYDDHDNRIEERYGKSPGTYDSLIETRYVYDDHGNWIRQAKLSNSIPTHIIEREISYYE